MLDDFREQANSGSFFNEEELTVEAPSYETRRLFLGMTAGQRFLLITMIMILTLLLSTVVLVVSEKMALPFL